MNTRTETTFAQAAPRPLAPYRQPQGPFRSDEKKRELKLFEALSCGKMCCTSQMTESLAWMQNEIICSRLSLCSQEWLRRYSEEEKKKRRNRESFQSVMVLTDLAAVCLCTEEGWYGRGCVEEVWYDKNDPLVVGPQKSANMPGYTSLT